MAKPKAPRWLTESFKDGVDERYAAEAEFMGDEGVECWPAQFDPQRRQCEGRFERFHFLGRQRVEHTLGGLLPTEIIIDPKPGEEVYGSGLELLDWTDFILLAGWDPRNGGIACEAHHRRLDSHLVPLPSEQLVVPFEALPEHVLDFASDYGFEEQLEAKYESIEGAA